MGEDGHVASLFPGSPALAAGLDPSAPSCIAVPMGTDGPPPQPRLTLTAPVLTSARRILLIVTGQAKRDVLEQAVEGYDALEFPVRAVLHGAAPVRILWSA
jgi:6-phosphogluconolactonase